MIKYLQFPNNFIELFKKTSLKKKDNLSVLK